MFKHKQSSTRGYTGTVGWAVRRPLRVLLIYTALGAAMVFLFLRTPQGFLHADTGGEQ